MFHPACAAASIKMPGGTPIFDTSYPLSLPLQGSSMVLPELGRYALDFP